MSVEDSILARLRFGEPGDTHPPRISRSIYNLSSRVVLLSDLFNVIAPAGILPIGEIPR